MAVYQIGQQAIKPTLMGEIGRSLQAYQAGKQQYQKQKMLQSQQQLLQMKQQLLPLEIKNMLSEIEYRGKQGEQLDKLKPGDKAIRDYHALLDYMFFNDLMGQEEYVYRKGGGKGEPPRTAQGQRGEAIQQRWDLARAKEIEKKLPHISDEMRAAIDKLKFESGSSVLARKKAKLLDELDNAATTPERRKEIKDILGGIKVSVQNITPGENIPPAKTVATSIQKKMLGIIETQQKLNYAAENFSKKFLTYQGKAGYALARKMDKAGVASEKQKKYIGEYTTWFKPAKQYFQEYKRAITGVAAGEREIKDIKESTINEDMSPTEFETTVNVLTEMGEKMYNRFYMLRVMGFDPNIEENREKIHLDDVPLDRMEAIRKAEQMKSGSSVLTLERQLKEVRQKIEALGRNQ